MRVHPSEIIAPAFGAEDCAVVFTVDRNIIPYAGVTLQSIVDHADAERRYDIVFLHTGLPSLARRTLEAQTAGRPNVSLRFADAREALARSGIEQWPRWPGHHPILFLRLLIPSLMPEYRRVVYLDGDVLAMTDIAELHGTALGDSLLGGVRNSDTPHVMATNPSMRAFLSRVFGDAPSDAINTGVLLFNIPQIRRENADDAWVGERHPAADDLVMMDEGWLNLCCRGRIRHLDGRWNVIWPQSDGEHVPPLSPPDEEAWMKRYWQNAAILHYATASVRARWMFKSDLTVPWWLCARKTPFYEQLLAHGDDWAVQSLRREMAREMGVGHRLRRYASTILTAPFRWLKRQ